MCARLCANPVALSTHVPVSPCDGRAHVCQREGGRGGGEGEGKGKGKAGAKVISKGEGERGKGEGEAERDKGKDGEQKRGSLQPWLTLGTCSLGLLGLGQARRVGPEAWAWGL